MSNELTANARSPSAMNESEYQQVIAELQTVIDETQHTLDRFEATGMEDYEKLLVILNDAVRQ